MTNRKTCSCCSKPMMRHITKNRSYWFCRSCWQEIPLQTITPKKYRTTQYQQKFLVEKNAPLRISL